jgi:hypothetical protein
MPKSLTLFTSPKPFTGHAGLIQRNALKNWSALGLPVILFGTDEGVQEAAAEFGFLHIPDVLCSEYGTPRLDDMFFKAQEAATTPLVSYINGDILLMPSFETAADALASRFEDFLMIGRRTDVDIVTELDFSAGWETQLSRLMQEEGVLHEAYGIDYFVFPRGSISTMPPFIIGRQGWDNWLVWTSAEQGKAVVNASSVVSVIHQNHDFSHIPEKKDEAWIGSPESQINLKLIENSEPDLDFLFASIYRAPWRLTHKGIQQDMQFDRLSWYSKKLVQRALAPTAPILNRSLQRLLPDPVYQKLRQLWRTI